jgi:predicted DNA-binding protein (MmcQ/YjbR family)
VRLDRLKSHALSLPQTTVVNQWGGLVFKVAGKVFLMIILDGGTIDGIIFKCTPGDFDTLTEIDGITQAPYCAKRMWVRVSDPAALPESELQRRIRASYRLVVAKLPKKYQAALQIDSAD